MISKGNHVNFTRIGVGGEAETLLLRFCVQCIKNKQVLESVIAISRIIKVSVRIIKQSQRLRMKTLCPDEELIDTER